VIERVADDGVRCRALQVAANSAAVGVQCRALGWRAKIGALECGAGHGVASKSPEVGVRCRALGL